MEDRREQSNQPSEKGKGKGKEKAPEDFSAPSENDRGLVVPGESQATGGSTISRIANSATSLANSLLSSPPNLHDAGQILSWNKAGPSNQAYPSSSISESLEYTSREAQGSSSSAFKSAHVQDYNAREEASFSAFLNGTAVQEPSSHDATDQIFTSHDASRVIPKASRISPNSEYAETDGMEVVKLLDAGYDEVMQPKDDVPFTRDEAATLRAALFGNVGPTNGGLPLTKEEKISLLDKFIDFVPDFISRDGDVSGHSERSSHLGLTDPVEAKQAWAFSWHDVMRNYHEEVWGDITPLVREASEEIRKLSESQENASPSDLKALQRLRQILAHIRGSQTF